MFPQIFKARKKGLFSWQLWLHLYTILLNMLIISLLMKDFVLAVTIFCVAGYKKVYKSLVHPILGYCSADWDPKCVTNPKDGDKTSHGLAD